MRPVRRGASPVHAFTDYRDAYPHLVHRLGPFCSYCERRVQANLAVEHIQPKSLVAYAHLENDWTNFLLACVNCNSTKGDDDHAIDAHLFPDRDNTIVAYRYRKDGEIEVSHTITPAAQGAAAATLFMVGLDKALNVALDENGQQVAIDRVSQRMEAWSVALQAVATFEESSALNHGSASAAVVTTVTNLALATGFFSIWIEAFAGHADMIEVLVDAFPGTLASGCFSYNPFAVVAPHPNADNLAHGGKC